MKKHIRFLGIGMCGAMLLAACGSAAAPSAPASSAAPKASTAGSVSASAKPAPASAVASAAASRPAASALAAASGGVTIMMATTSSLSNLPAWLAVERGYFKAEGLEMQVVPFRSATDEVAPLASGQLLIGAGGVSVGLFNAIARGIPLRIVSDQAHDPPEFQGTGWLVRKDLLDSGRVKTPKDIKGLTVGIAAPGTAEDSELGVLEQQGGFKAADVTMKTVGYADQVAAFANKSIDITYNFEPQVGIMRERGLADMWITSGQLIPNHEPTVNLYSPAFVEKYPDLAKGWMVGYLKGVRDVVKAYAAPTLADDVVSVITKYSTLRDPAQVRKIKIAPINPDGYVYQDSLKTDLEFFTKSGQLTTAPKLADVVDSSFVDYALTKIGKFS